MQPQSESNLYQSSNILAQKLFNTFEEKSVYSPLSIAYILSLLHFGAVENTDKQLTDLLAVKNSLENLFIASKTFNTSIIKLANAIVINKCMPVKQEYLDIVGKLAFVSNADFSNAQVIVTQVNSFIEKNTNNLIKDVLKTDMIGIDSIMILINTLYFKADWTHQFKKKNTRQEKFNIGSTNTSDVDMMTNTKYYPYFEDSNVQQVELPYKGMEFCMGFVLPNVNNNNMNVCGQYLENTKFESGYVEVHIPKFTQRKNLDLIPSLQKLGLTDIFCNKSRMDNMIDVPGTYARVSTMIHEAVVIVDESGTEAAAVTVAVMRMECMMIKPDPIVFNANHSFVYYIKHKPTNTLLFVGDYHGN